MNKGSNFRGIRSMVSLVVLGWCLIICAGSALAVPLDKVLDDKVVNGVDASQGSHPHKVTLQRTFFGLWFHVCGGTVIDNNFVLTAAHCVDYAPAEEFRVVVNDHNLYESDGPEQTIGITRIYIHDDWINAQDYDFKIFPNDIALLLLDTEVMDKTNIIPLASDDDEDFAGVTCTISGWGLNDTNGVIPNTLQEVNMTVMSLSDCAEYWVQLWPNDAIDLFQGQICIFAGEDPVLGASACSGDSGGPMVCNGMLAGVTSWGVLGCRDMVTQEFRPSVYARVSYYYPWIQTVMNRFQIGRG